MLKSFRGENDAAGRGSFAAVERFKIASRTDAGNDAESTIRRSLYSLNTWLPSEEQTLGCSKHLMNKN